MILLFVDDPRVTQVFKFAYFKKKKKQEVAGLFFLKCFWTIIIEKDNFLDKIII